MVKWLHCALHCPYSNIQQQLSSGSMQDLHEVADALLPDVECVLPGWTSHDVLTIPRETAALPWSPDKDQIIHFYFQFTDRMVFIEFLSIKRIIHEHRKSSQDMYTQLLCPHVLQLNGAAVYLLTRSWSFCMGSGSPSRPQVSISLPSYTLMILSAVFMRKQLHREQDRWN